MNNQERFDLMIGRLDRILSEMVVCAPKPPAECVLDAANRQTLKHHAEDMILAGAEIMRRLGYDPNKVLSGSGT